MGIKPLFVAKLPQEVDTGILDFQVTAQAVWHIGWISSVSSSAHGLLIHKRCSSAVC